MQNCETLFPTILQVYDVIFISTCEGIQVKVAILIMLILSDIGTPGVISLPDAMSYDKDEIVLVLT